MNSYEFMCGITHDLGNIRAFFDATMALYQIMNAYNGFAITGQQIDGPDSAIISYTIVPSDVNVVDKFINDINGLNVGMYGRCYRCEATIHDTNVILITLHRS